MAATAKQTDHIEEIDEEIDEMTDRDIPPIHWVTPEEGRAIFDEHARQTVGMSGEEFLRRFDAGEFDDVIEGPDHITLIDLIMMIPLARQDTR